MKFIWFILAPFCKVKTICVPHKELVDNIFIWLVCAVKDLFFVLIDSWRWCSHCLCMECTILVLKYVCLSVCSVCLQCTSLWYVPVSLCATCMYCVYHSVCT